MLTTFMTVISSIWAVWWLLGLVFTFYEWNKLTPYQQHKAKITIEPLGSIMFLVALAWLTTKAIS
jgi:hypothetical protein